MPPQPFKPTLRAYQRSAFFLAVFLTIRDHILEIDPVRGASMAPTLSPQAHTRGLSDLVIIQRYKPTASLRRGDIVTFWKPHKPEEISIKRVVALEGDEVFPRDREMGTIGGYGGHGVRGNFDTEGGESLRVPFGHVWVEGDNWRGSYDSNDFGPISKSLIDGKASYVVRKWWRWERIPERVRERGETRVRPGRAVLPDVYLM